MAISESTYLDRYGRAETLNTAIGAFLPAFDPSNDEITPASFTAFLEEVDAANDAVTTARDNYTGAVEQRNDLVTDAKDRAGRVISQLQSNPAWSQNLTAIKRHYDKMRGYRPSRPKPPAEDESTGSEPEKKRNQGERGHAEMAKHISNIATGLEKMNNYATPVPDITAVAMRALADQYAALNRTMGELEIEVNLAQPARYKLYESETGLRERMKAIKNAVRAQYGTKSDQYLAVKGIKL